MGTQGQQVDFASFVEVAAGFRPYPYQSELARDGLPALLRAPTGSGKSVAAVLPWLWRRRAHPDTDVRTSTPRWLVVALPLRTLVDQFERQVDGWLSRLEMNGDVGLHVLLGGRSDETPWSQTPGRDAIIIGSIDMLLSRALNRGYASGRFRWPLDFGMLNNGTQWVFDEVQLLGPALPTSRQLQALRSDLGTVLPTHSMWMSATVDPSWLHTVDAGSVASTLELTRQDRTGELAGRLSATRRIEHLADVDPTDHRAIASAVLANHRASTRTIVMCNTVARAQSVFKALRKITEIPSVLVHSRMRPADRSTATHAALDDVGSPGRIVVSTQALEAGVDVSSDTLITELAPWTSVVQRAGRCNRDGRAPAARFLWFDPAAEAPYEAEQLAVAKAALTDLEGQEVTGEYLGDQALEPLPHLPVLRRRDLVDLFDTSPDLSGNDTDVSMYIRDGEDRDVFVAWRAVDGTPDKDVGLRDDELVRVPIGQARTWTKSRTDVWFLDHLAGQWSRVRAADLRPGLTLLADAGMGGYDAALGWDPSSGSAVAVIAEPEEYSLSATALETTTDTATDDDPLTRVGVWVTLQDHLDDAAQQARQLATALGLDPGDPLVAAVIDAASLHDIGKAHPVFQETLHKSAGDDEHPDHDTVWAKSSKRRKAGHARRHFRHELVSLLLLRTPATAALLGNEADLVRYLVAAHHGRVRLGVRSLPNESTPPERPDALMALGVIDGEELPAVTVHGVEIPSIALDLRSVTSLGGEGSWTRATLTLRDRTDLGPFRLAFLEALVVLADWMASNQPSRTIDVSASPAGVA